MVDFGSLKVSRDRVWGFFFSFFNELKPDISFDFFKKIPSLTFRT
jgi:hypothetical protein